MEARAELSKIIYAQPEASHPTSYLLDLRRIKMPMKRALDRINDYLSRDHKIKRLVVIDKNHKVIDIL